jgi:26S proteasome regulatory subunit N9
MCFILNIIVGFFFLQVELLVMKALSLGLVKGFIDEIDQKVSLTWVQPRVLDLQQVSI